ncbi:MAG: DUF3560 domain-containing protein [Mesorhizobium sp.]|uniref:DUF3560 domain-containing protein n=1 Tax=Mesorhizobium sp. TaxID=1871066 RepID=UPI001AC97A23|nr:DUF3560 domain-containing protein [Mesorhizobium sp.]MBN9219569.1 DUF3560 domain-containing protein [Mesorhizobium sp.]
MKQPLPIEECMAKADCTTTLQAYRILGNTYKERHRIRQAGGVYSHELGGHIIPADARDLLADIVGAHGLEEVQVETDFFKPLTGEALRNYRTQRNLRRADRLEERARSARKHAAGRDLKPHERDFLSLGEPVKVGHHSERRHRKLLDRAQKSLIERGQLLSKADGLERRADSLRTPACIKGDAARDDERICQWHRQNTKVGDSVNWLGQTLKVLKVNRVSFRLEVSATPLPSCGA